jgi:hypothetical protein
LAEKIVAEKLNFFLELGPLFSYIALETAVGFAGRGSSETSDVLKYWKIVAAKFHASRCSWGLLMHIAAMVADSSSNRRKLLSAFWSWKSYA